MKLSKANQRLLQNDAHQRFLFGGMELYLDGHDWFTHGELSERVNRGRRPNEPRRIVHSTFSDVAQDLASMRAAETDLRPLSGRRLRRVVRLTGAGRNLAMGLVYAHAKEDTSDIMVIRDRLQRSVLGRFTLATLLEGSAVADAFETRPNERSLDSFVGLPVAVPDDLPMAALLQVRDLASGNRGAEPADGEQLPPVLADPA